MWFVDYDIDDFLLRKVWLISHDIDELFLNEIEE